MADENKNNENNRLNIFGGFESQQAEVNPNQEYQKDYKNEYNEIILKLNQDNRQKEKLAETFVAQKQFDGLNKYWQDNSVTNNEYNQSVSSYNSLSKGGQKEFSADDRVSKTRFYEVNQAQKQLKIDANNNGESGKLDLEYQKYSNLVDARNKVAGSSTPPVPLMPKSQKYPSVHQSPGDLYRYLITIQLRDGTVQ